MFTEVLSADRLNLLARLKEKKLLQGVYMAGGTAVALQLGHRKSEDFDFFSDLLDTESMINSLAATEPFEVTGTTQGSLHGLIHNVKISFLLYPYPLLYQPHSFRDVPLANLIDIALMKIVAIANRGSNKDFVDLYCICQEVISLEELIFSLFPKKYSGQQYSLYHAMKSLQYFEDAENSPPLDLIQPIEWETVKTFFLEETKHLSKMLVQHDK